MAKPIRRAKVGEGDDFEEGGSASWAGGRPSVWPLISGAGRGSISADTKCDFYAFCL